MHVPTSTPETPMAHPDSEPLQESTDTNSPRSMNLCIHHHMISFFMNQFHPFFMFFFGNSNWELIITFTVLLVDHAILIILLLIHLLIKQMNCKFCKWCSTSVNRKLCQLTSFSTIPIIMFMISSSSKFLDDSRGMKELSNWMSSQHPLIRFHHSF